MLNFKGHVSQGMIAIMIHVKEAMSTTRPEAEKLFNRTVRWRINAASLDNGLLITCLQIHITNFGRIKLREKKYV